MIKTAHKNILESGAVTLPDGTQDTSYPLYRLYDRGIGRFFSTLFDPVELLLNGGFEDGDLTSWLASGSTLFEASTSNPRTGSYCAHASIDSIWEQQRSSFGTDAIRGVAHDGTSLWVAVSDTGKLATSPDGITWTQQTSPFGGDSIRGVAYGGALWVAVGANGKLATSPDGITWTLRTSSFGTTTIFHAAHDGSSLWVAVGSSGKLATSPDGITWTQQTSSFVSDSIYSVAHDGTSLWVAAGASGKLATSSNGTSWTQRTSSFGSDIIYSVAHDGSSQWAAVGINGKLASSPDAITWTQRTSYFDTTTIWGVAYGGGQWVAGGTDGRISTSSDGLSWEPQPSAFGTDAIRGIAYDGTSLWVAVGANGKLASSPDGIAWTLRTSSFGSDLIRGIAYGGGQWVAVGINGKLATSPDGINWTQQTSSFGTSTITHSSYSNSLWVAVGSSGKLATSSDGINWTSQTSSFGTDTIYSVARSEVGLGADVWVAVGINGKLASSPDAITWTQQTSTFSTTTIWDVAHNGQGRWVIVGNSGKLATSPDGINWTSQTSSFGTDLIYGVAHAGDPLDNTGIWMAISAVGTIASSPDGINWVQQVSRFDTTVIWDVAHGDDLWICGADDGKIGTNTFSALSTLEHDVMDIFPDTDIVYDYESYYIFSLSSTITTLRIKAEFLDSGDVSLSTATLLTRTSGILVYTQEAQTFGFAGSGADIIMPAGTAKVRHYFEVVSSHVGADIRIDDVSFEAGVYDFSVGIAQSATDIKAIDRLLIPSSHNLEGVIISISWSDDGISYTQIDSFTASEGTIARSWTALTHRYWLLEFAGIEAKPFMAELFLTSTYDWERPADRPTSGPFDPVFNVLNPQTAAGQDRFLVQGAKKERRRYGLPMTPETMRDAIDELNLEWAGANPFWLFDHEDTWLYGKLQNPLDESEVSKGIHSMTLDFLEVIA